MHKSTTTPTTTAGNFTSMPIILKMLTSQILEFLTYNNSQVHFIWSVIPWVLPLFEIAPPPRSKTVNFPFRPCFSSFHFLYLLAVLYMFFFPLVTSSPQSLLLATMYVALFQIHLPLYLVLISYSTHCHDIHLNGCIIHNALL